ncbi:QWRF motif-containing protein 7 [Ricinus communis]|uniref:QWRF motif-containing protein n=1 Tax=Ricinus communis TaxID=3988 RepID=B9R9U8_RICCO|nr:QWRF motif-containing protein 7 [Ricinus communis]EEF51575.1 conserved hypothetical protein [Ricinus communis]|eukprot:XP_025015003.1 QWRF motif-containing protein 7 [Ricinus communis]
MEYPLTRRKPPTSASPSPRLVRSRSGAENNSTSINTSRRFTSRSKSTTRSRNTPNEQNISLNSSLKPQKKSASNQDNCSSRDGSVRFLQRGSASNSPAPNYKMPKSASRSPSAWALSPGRSLFNVLPQAELPVISSSSGEERGKKVKSGSGGAISGVLRYFRQKKASSVQEEECRRFRVLHNRILQWRFANAKADAAMASTKIIAENKLFHVWLRILNVRTIILEKRIQILKLKQEVKLFEIVNPQMHFLNDWAKIERKNYEAVGRMTRKLSALSVKLPLVEEATGDVESILKAMSTAAEVMDSIEATITKFFPQVEKILYLLTELTSTLEHQKDSLGEMEKIVFLVSELLAWERSIRVQLIQVVEESRTEQGL